MHAKTWFPSNEMHESPNLTNEPLCAYRGQCNFSSNSKDTFLPLYRKKVAFLSERKLSLRKVYFTEEKYTLRRKSLLYGGKVNFPSVKFTFPWKSALSLRKVNFTEEK